jgi:hypothetical protein
LSIGIKSQKIFQNFGRLDLKGRKTKLKEDEIKNDEKQPSEEALKFPFS